MVDRAWARRQEELPRYVLELATISDTRSQRRVAGDRGLSEAHRSGQLPPASPSDYKNVEVVALGRDAAVVTYERPAPGGATGAAGESLIFRGTAAFIRTAEGWKIAAWHAHSVPERSSPH